MLKEIIPEPFQTPTTLALMFLTAILIVVLLCFICGVLARRAIARRFTQTLEKQLMTVFPKYGIYKDLLAGNIGGDEHAPSLIPVTVQFNEYSRLAFESERLADGRVVVYLPGAPDAWIGSVVLVADNQVERLEIPLPDFIGVFERLGRDCTELSNAGSGSSQKQQ